MNYLPWLCVLSLCAAPAAGQHVGSLGGAGRGDAPAGFGHGGFGPGGFAPGNSGRRAYHGAGGFNQHFGSLGRFSSYGFPYAFPLWFDGGYDYGYPPPSPSVVVIQQPAPQTIIEQAPSPVVQTVIHDYTEFSSGAARTSPAAPDEEATFAIALRDGSRLAASAVWVQDSTVHYIDTEDRSHEVPLTSINRELTRKLNRERNLNLRLPGS